MTPRSYTDEDLAHERAMQAEGELAYERRARRAKEFDELTLVAPGRAILRASLDPVERAITEWIKRAKKGPTVGGQALPYLEKVKPGVAALLATSVVVDGLHRTRSATDVSAAIGKALEDQWRFSEVSRTDKQLMQEIERRGRDVSPSLRRRIAVTFSRDAGVLPPTWDPRERLRLGAVLLELVAEATGLVEFDHVRTGVGGKSPRSRLLVAPSGSASEWLESAEARSASLSPMWMPTLSPPAPWEGTTGGGYLTDLVLGRTIARFRGGQQRRILDEQGVHPTVLGALNALQAVQYRVNEDVLVAMEHLLEVGGTPLSGLADEPYPPKPADIDTNSEARKQWSREKMGARRRNLVRRSRRIAIMRTVSVARRLVGRTIYYPHRLDFRGRVYPIPHWMSPQGPDPCRGLLLFDEGEPLRPEGWSALLDYGRTFFPDHQGQIEDLAAAVYHDPLDRRDWTEAEDAFQALAWCLEVGRIVDEGGPEGSVSRLPVFVDASNNGLQLFALITGDRALAEATNAIGEGGGDLYQDVADAAYADVLLDTRQGDEHALGWQEILAPLSGVPRDCAKRPVMTLPYGVTLWSAQGYVRDWHDEVTKRKGPFASHGGKACRYLAQKILGRVWARCKGAVRAMIWLEEAARKSLARGEPLQWTTPSGWVVVQEYAKYKRSRIRAYLGGAVRSLRVRRPGRSYDGKKQAQAAAPNFIHSLDAAVLHLFVQGWGRPVVTVHDAYGVLPNDVHRAKERLRAVVADVVQGDPLKKLQTEVQARTGARIEDPPRLGEIAREEILNAKRMYE